MPSSSYTYAIDQDLAKNLGIRKYGFHGSSHSFVSKSAAKFLGIEPSSFNAVILHLGNGASACAIKGGKSFDTSMGMTPLAGLVMGSRSGDIDPAVIFYLIRQGGFTAEKVDELLNKQSGLLGVSGVSDFRDLLEKAQLGDQRAKLALELFVERIRHYLGAYAARLGRLDAVVFTGGIGENSQVLRQMVCENMEILGLSIDEDLNKSKDNSPRKISRGVVPILVIPTNEELEIAMQAQLALGEK
jgi:acetate kinase